MTDAALDPNIDSRPIFDVEISHCSNPRKVESSVKSSPDL